MFALACAFVVAVATPTCADDGQRATSSVYVMSNPDGEPNDIVAYSRDRNTGGLTFLDRFATGGIGDAFVGGFEQHALIAHRDNLYAVNPGDDTISAFQINKDGSLRLLGTVPSGGRRPVALAATGRLLYVANSGNSPVQDPEQPSYSGFRIREDGSLDPIPDSTVLLDVGDVLADVVFNRSGDVLMGSRLLANKIDSFRVGNDGRLSNHNTIPGGGGPFGLLAIKERTLLAVQAVPELFTDELAPGIASYTINHNGRLGLLDSYTDPDVSDEGLRDPCWLTATPSGQYVWTSSFIPRMLTLFRVRGRGELTRVSSYNPLDVEDPGPPEVILGSTDVDISKDGKFVYQLRVFSVPDGAVPLVPKSKVLRVTKDWETNGGLSEASTTLLPEDLDFTGTMGLVVYDSIATTPPGAESAELHRGARHR